MRSVKLPIWLCGVVVLMSACRSDVEARQGEIVLLVAAAREGPFAELITAKHKLPGIRGSYCWSEDEVEACGDSVLPRPKTFFEVKNGSQLRVESDAEDVELFLIPSGPGDADAEPAQGSRVNLTGSRERLVAAPPGRYLLSVFATWPEGDSEFFFPLLIV